MKTQITFALLLTVMASGSHTVKSETETEGGHRLGASGNDDWTWLDAWAASASSPLAVASQVGVASPEEQDPEVHSRERRAVDLRTLRRLMSNIALSEFYRLRGLEVLGSLGMGHGKPGGIPSPLATAIAANQNDQETSASAPKSSVAGSSIFNFPLRPEEFQQFFGALGRSHFAKRG